METDTGKRVLIVGGGQYSGGREVALAHKYSQSPQVDKVYLWPGNDLAWTSSQVPTHCFAGESVTDAKRIVQAARDLNIDLVDVASDRPLAAGVVDNLQKHRIPTFGAASGAAKLETDKNFSRQVQQKMGLSIPRYHYERYSTRDRVHRALDDWYRSMCYSKERPSVIKANGLADGKGVFVADSQDEAHFGLDHILSQPFGWQTGVLFEERVGGPTAQEWSDFFLIGRGPDSRSPFSAHKMVQWFNHLGYAQDHKRIGEGDTGLNTGGMGAVSSPLFVQLLQSRLWGDVYPKIINGLRQFSSTMILYASWMYDSEADQIWLIEFNTRHGDPEAQVVLPGIKNDYFDLIDAATHSRSSKDTIIEQRRTCRISAAVVTKGYPGDCIPNTNQPIRHIWDIIDDNNVTVYGAGARQVGSSILTGNGRNLHIVAEDSNVFKAYDSLNIELDRLGGPVYFRRDIGFKEAKYIDDNYQSLVDEGLIVLPPSV